MYPTEKIADIQDGGELSSMVKSVIIIGGGIAGLATGCYARMNGYDTHIFEMHDKPGGLCTAWNRKGYTIDGCLHWLVGSAPGSELYKYWMELGALQGQKIVNQDIFAQAEDISGNIFQLYSNIDHLEKHMLKLAPEDSRLIKSIATSARKFTSMVSMEEPSELQSPLRKLLMLPKILPFMGDLRRWGRLTMRELAEQFSNPLLRTVFSQFWIADMSAITLLMTMAGLHQQVSGYMIGGSAKLAGSIEKRYSDLGGTISYRSPVEKILVESNRAVGIRLKDGSEHRADYVVSAADGHATIYDMLDGNYLNDTIRKYYEKSLIFQPLVYIGLGVNQTFENEPELGTGLYFEIDNPVWLAGEERKWMNIRIFNFDPTLAPAGKTVMTCSFETNYPYWEELYKNKENYKAEKEQIADTVISLLEKRFPGLASRVEMRDVATPITFRRYTGNWQGSFEGWLITPGNFGGRMSKTLPGLDSFYMAGHWVQPGGGLPSGVMTGRQVTQFLCKRDGKRFQTTLP